jgi:hypothetical protein
MLKRQLRPSMASTVSLACPPGLCTTVTMPLDEAGDVAE